MINKLYEKIKRFIVDNYKFLIALLVINLLFWVQLPYVIYAPGGAIDLSDRISVEDGYESDGKLQMAYVTMVKGSIPFLLASYIIPNWDIVPKSDVTYDNETLEQTIQMDKIDLQASQDCAVISAFNLANEEIEITDYHNTVTYIADEAQTDLELLDEIISVDDKKVESIDDYKEIVNDHQEGDILTLKVKRDEKEQEVKIKVYNTEYGLKTGIMFTTTYDYETKKEVKLKTKSSESGPSGGLMSALSIYDALVEEDLTKGKNIIGTGTIDEFGNIGQIGGVKYKLIGAVKNDAEVFIVPEENYEEAKKVATENNYDIIIITDKNLSGIVSQLKALS